MTKTITSFPISCHSAFLQCTLIAEQSKLETIKMMGARSKINAISLNVRINERKSVHIRGYILPINVQNFMQKHWAQAKISMKLAGGLLFLTHPVYRHEGCNSCASLCFMFYCMFYFTCDRSFSITRVRTDIKTLFPGLSRTCKDRIPGFSRTRWTRFQGL